MPIGRAPRPTPQIRNRFRTEPGNKKRAPTQNLPGGIRTRSALQRKCCSSVGLRDRHLKTEIGSEPNLKIKRAPAQNPSGSIRTRSASQRCCCSSVGLRNRHPQTEIGSEQNLKIKKGPRPGTLPEAFEPHRLHKGTVAHRPGSETDTPKQKSVPNRTGK